MAQLRNPTAEVLLGEMGLSIAKFHKAEAARLLAKHELKDPSTFYWRGRRGSPRKAANIAAIPDAPLARPPATIAFVDSAKGSIIADVAVAAAMKFRRSAPVSTGRYACSLVFELNGKRRPLTSIVRFATTNPFSAKETISIYPAVEYASKLEADYYARSSKGILFKIAAELQTEFGARASIKFVYAPGMKLGLPFKYAVPMIIVGGPGQFASTLKRPGGRARARARKARRSARQ
jgi:hypothetical protein